MALVIYENGAMTEVSCGPDSGINTDIGDSTVWDAMSCLCPDNQKAGTATIGGKKANYGGMYLGCPPKWGGNNQTYFDAMNDFKKTCEASGGTPEYTDRGTGQLMDWSCAPGTTTPKPVPVPEKPTPDTPKTPKVVVAPPMLASTPASPKPMNWLLLAILAGGGLWLFTRKGK